MERKYKDMDFSEHNKEVKKVWQDYYAGKSSRMPMILGVNPRVWLLNPRLNTEGITFEQYSNDPDIMYDVQLKFREYVAYNLYADHEMGVPENGWILWVDLQNVFDAGWLGAEIWYPEGNVPASRHFLNDDNKNALFEKGLPSPFAGAMGKARDFLEHMKKRAEGDSFLGAAIKPCWTPGLATDGPMTVACNIRGTTEFCIDLYEDPDYASQLLSFITEATIARIKGWRRYFGQPEIQSGFGFADDSIALLSTKDYIKFILPYHKQLVNALSDGSRPNSIHLCGNATHLFETLRDELNITSFDTGFPVRHGELTKQLGRNITIQGGPHADFLRTATPLAISAETRRIIEEVKPNTDRFVMREGNNVAPCTPEENIKAMYDTVREFGIY